MTNSPKIKIDIIANLLDSLIIVILGLVLIQKGSLIIGIIVILLGIIQLARKIKIIYLNENFITIHRLLIPFSIADQNFALNDIKEVKFHKIKGRFGGNYISIKGKKQSGSYSISNKKEPIDCFQNRLNEFGIKTIRDEI